MCNDYSNAAELANLAKDAKLKEKDVEKANKILDDSFSQIKTFDDGMFVQSVVKYSFPERLPEYAELMYPLAESVEELLYSADFFRRYDLTKCTPCLQRAEEKAQTLNDLLQLCGIYDLVDKKEAQRVFNKAEQLAVTFEEKIQLLQEHSYFYGWPEFITIEKVKQLISETVKLAKSADHFRALSNVFAYFADKLDPTERKKRLKKRLTG